MKILQVHNRYLSGQGGEDSVLAADRALLFEHGHEVDQFFGTNEDFGTARGLSRVALGARAIWSVESHAALLARIREDRPDVAHVHNTFAQLSGSIYWALAKERIPVVQTLHNYRWLCPNSMLLRDGRPCEQCVGRSQLPAMAHGCTYNGSLAASMVIAASNTTHSAIGTYRKKVHAIIALTEFMRSRLILSGLDDDRVHVRPNFLADPGLPSGDFDARARQLVFVGLIDTHKGVALCTDAWDAARPEGWRLVMVGDGSRRQELKEKWSMRTDIDWTGKLPRDDALAFISASRFLVLPSLCYEGLPMTVLEAMSRGTPAIVPDHGAFPEIVDDGINGIVFKAGDTASLRDALQRATQMSRAHWQSLAANARARFMERYSTGIAYEKLMLIYARATAVAQDQGRAVP